MYSVIHRIEIYPAENVIQPSKNRGVDIIIFLRQIRYPWEPALVRTLETFTIFPKIRHGGLSAIKEFMFTKKRSQSFPKFATVVNLPLSNSCLQKKHLQSFPKFATALYLPLSNSCLQTEFPKIRHGGLFAIIEFMLKFRNQAF